MKKIYNFIFLVLFILVSLTACKNSKDSSKSTICNNESISFSSEVTSISSTTSQFKDKVMNIYINYKEDIKYEYYLGEQLDLTNLNLNVVYESGKLEIINVIEEMIELFDTSINHKTNMNSVGYKMVIINYEGCETSYLIHVIDKNAPFDKIDPVVNFNFEAGTVFYLESEIVPTLDVLPNDIDYVITYSSEVTGYNSEEYPTEPGKYSMVVKYEGDDRYYSINKWRYFILKGAKEKAEVIFNYKGGTTFEIGSDIRPTVSVTEGAEYTITYSSETTGYNSEEYPTEPGTYSLVVTIKEDDNFYYDKKWLWFRLVSDTKQKAEVIFNYNPGDKFSLNSTDRPTAIVSEGADYTTYFSCEEKQFKGETYIFETFEELEPGYDYSLVVSIKENDKYNADEKWCWFSLVE